MVRQDHSCSKMDSDDEGEEEPEQLVRLHFDITVSYTPPKARDPYGSEYIWLGVMVRDGRIGMVDSEGYVQPHIHTRLCSGAEETLCNPAHMAPHPTCLRLIAAATCAAHDKDMPGR